MPDNTLTGLSAIVTAAGGGAGRVIAAKLAGAGASVVACDIDMAGLASLTSQHPGIRTVVADMADSDAITRIVAAVDGPVDILVNNVGIAGPTAPVEEVTLADWDHVLRVNLTSHFLFAKAVVPGMKARRSGLIVNISSGSARVGLPLRLPYVVSKSAVMSLTMNLARELGPHGIRCNAILPGAIRGERINRVITAKAAALGVSAADYEADMLRYISLRQMVEPEDIAAMILYLAGPGGQRISGQMLGVDGNIEWEE